MASDGRQQRSDAPAPMEGGGFYNRSSAVQAAGQSAAALLLAQAASLVPLPSPPQPVAIADYGASQGRNSLQPINLAIDALRKRSGSPVCVIHTDLPENDFTSLFETIASDPASYMQRHERVYPSAIGRSFYEQLLPAQSVHLGWSSWAVQWLSRIPCPIPDQVQIAYSRDKAAHAAYAAQAADDWRAFLTHRASELVDGGRLVIVTMAIDDSGDFGYQPLLAHMYQGLEAMVADGFIHADEFHRMAIPTVGRGRADVLAPFAAGPFHGLSVEQIELFHEPDHIWADYERDRDAASYGSRWAAFSRTSVFPTLAAPLKAGRRAEFMNRLERYLAESLARDPRALVIPLVQLTVSKAAGG